MSLAHVGHWYAELLYVAPVVLVAGWLALAGRREKRRGPAAGGGRDEHA
ncbi:MAG: hypothetical protein JWO90_99 [Solirubrobacterales bacterium]|nr:hypothetical protein [Solirubrobacterales bacterium]